MRRHHVTDAKIDLDRLLDEAQSEPIGIERRGRIRAVLVGLARFEGMRARRAELESELRQARDMLEKLGYEVEGLRGHVEDLRADSDHWRSLAEKLRHFVPKDADAFLLDDDADADPPDASMALAVPPGHAAAKPEPEVGPGFDEVPPPLPLDSYRLSTAEGRRSFLIALRDDHGAAGLLMAVTHLWESLGRPKAHHAGRIAASVGVGGRGRTALRRALERFIEESVADRTRSARPERAAFADDMSWLAAIEERQLQQERRDAAILRRWEAILSGHPPDEDEEPRGPAQIVKGPWRRTVRTKPGGKGEPPKPGS
jgi:PHD/YefM family antitoxin component YafN of YafNO toxin-antitoxin module